MRRAQICGIALLLAMARAAGAHPGISAAEDNAPSEPFGPRYVLDRIAIEGNAKTRSQVIEKQLLIHSGDVISADDPRIESSRFRVLGLGFFEQVVLSLRR